jgi:hypothetical protein
MLVLKQLNLGERLTTVGVMQKSSHQSFELYLHLAYIRNEYTVRDKTHKVV